MKRRLAVAMLYHNRFFLIEDTKKNRELCETQMQEVGRPPTIGTDPGQPKSKKHAESREWKDALGEYNRANWPATYELSMLLLNSPSHDFSDGVIDTNSVFWFQVEW